MSAGRLVLGVDLGGTKLRAALASLDGAIVAELVEATVHGADGVMVEQIGRSADELCRRAGTSRAAIAAAGVSLPATIDPSTGRLGSTHNVPGIASVDARAELTRVLGVSTFIDNDANLAALGEGWRGAAVGLDDFVVIAIGTGIGMGIVAGGRLVRGAHGAAGEVGFLPIGSDPLDPRSRVRGAYEEAVAGPALRARIDAAAGRGAATTLRAGATLADVVAAAASGDRSAAGLLDEEARFIALGIAAIAAILDPALVLLSGGVGSVEGLVGPVGRHTAALLQRPPQIRVGALGERAPLEGAIILALRSGEHR